MGKFNHGARYDPRSVDGGTRYNGAPPALFLQIGDRIPLGEAGRLRVNQGLADEMRLGDGESFVAMPFFYVSGYGVLEPLGLCIDFRESSFDIMPETRDTSEVVTGIDGEIWFDTRYEKRFFNFVGRSADGLSAQEKAKLKRLVQALLGATKAGTKLLMFYDRLESYEVKYSGGMDSETYPSWISLEFPLVAYDPHGYSPWENRQVGSGILRNRGELETEPEIEIRGGVSYPTVILNGRPFRYAGDIPADRTLHISTRAHTARIGTENVLDRWGVDFPLLLPGDNIVTADERVTITWRDKWN